MSTFRITKVNSRGFDDSNTAWVDYNAEQLIGSDWQTMPGTTRRIENEFKKDSTPDIEDVRLTQVTIKGTLGEIASTAVIDRASFMYNPLPLETLKSVGTADPGQSPKPQLPLIRFR